MILPPSCPPPPSPPSSERLGGIVEIEAKTQTEIAKPAAERRLGAAEHHRGLFSTLICSAQDSTPYLFRIMELNHTFFFSPLCALFSGVDAAQLFRSETWSSCEPPAGGCAPLSSCSSSFGAAPL